MNLRLVLLVAVALAASADASINTVTSLNLTQYLGRWYQPYASASVLDTFESGGHCIGAEYGLKANGDVSVFNFQRQKSATGPAKNITGYARVFSPGKLKVYFFGPSSGGDYWVIKLGPVVNGQYQYSLVSDPSKLSLYVLVRDVAEFTAKYSAEVLAYLKQQGFTHFWDEPKAVDESAQCIYPPASPELKHEAPVVDEFFGAMDQYVTLGSSEETLYKIKNGECGQSTLNSLYAKFAIAFADLKPGTCASQGYTVKGSSKTIHVPTLGSETVTFYTKPQ